MKIALARNNYRIDEWLKFLEVYPEYYSFSDLKDTQDSKNKVLPSVTLNVRQNRYHQYFLNETHK